MCLDFDVLARALYSLGSLENIWALLGLRCLQSPGERALARLAIVSGAGGEGSDHWGVHSDKIMCTQATTLPELTRSISVFQIRKLLSLHILYFDPRYR